MINGKKIGVALSGGASKGLCHIGVLDVLQKNGIIPDIIVGTSMGSIIAGLYACGVSPSEMENRFLNFKYGSFLDINVFNIFRQGVIAGKKLQKILDTNTNGVLIQNLKTKFACVACDIKTGKQYVFKAGKLSVAMRASCSMPGIFAPVKLNDMVLVDGGVVNNIPSDVAYNLGADYVISVDCIGNAFLTGQIKGVVDVLMSSFGTTQYLYEHARNNPANTKISITNKKFGFSEHSTRGIKSLINCGRAQAKKHINKIKADLHIVN